MSTVEARPRERQWNFLIRTKPPVEKKPVLETPPGRKLAEAGRMAWRAWCANRPLRAGIVSWLAAWVVLQTAFVGYVHYVYQGNSYWVFLPSTTLGIPAAETAAGMKPIGMYGYDGQQYYHISNDLLGRGDTPRHIDNPSYRYQRIGIPLLAAGLSGLLGFELTPPMLYHTLQFGITTAGFGLLVYWLMLKKQPAVFALAWLLSVGTLQSLWMGLLDAPADALLIAALAAALSRRMWLYVPAATMLLLTREMYCLFAFGIFLTTAWRRVAVSDAAGSWHPLRGIDWCDVRGYWQRVALAAVPGAVMLGWTTYLAVHFQISPIAARSLNPSAQSYPFVMMWNYLEKFFKADEVFEFRMAVISAFTLIAMLVFLLRGVRRLPWALLCMIPYVLMTTMLGAAMWEGHGSHMRVMDTALVVIGLFMLQFDGSLVLRFLLTLHAIVGPAVHYDLRMARQPLRDPGFICQDRDFYKPNPPGSPENMVLNDCASTVKWVDRQDSIQRSYSGVWNRYHRETRPITVAVTNRTSETWQPGLGKHPIYVGYNLFSDSRMRLLSTHSVLLDKPIPPGETREFTLYLEVLRPRRNYVVEFSVSQNGKGWFRNVDPAYGGEYEFRVE